MIDKWDQRFIDMAQLVATWSKDSSTKVGAVITRHHSVISVGFNGFPADMPDENEELWSNRDEKYSRIVHGEMNALLFAGKLPEGCSLYTFPFMSCDRCVVHMIQAGIKRFVAPKASPDKLERWGKAFDRTKQYISECGGTLLEIGD